MISNAIGYLLIALVVATIILAILGHRSSLVYKYRDVIVSRWQDADFYLGKSGGTEFQYKKGDPNCTWSQIARRDGWKCWMCGRKVVPLEKAIKKFGPFRFRMPFRREIHVDHLVAYALGGKGDTADDGRIACARCNIRRSAKIDEMCLQRVRELGKKIYIGKKVPPYKSTRKKRYKE